MKGALGRAAVQDAASYAKNMLGIGNQVKPVVCAHPLVWRKKAKEGTDRSFKGDTECTSRC